VSRSQIQVKRSHRLPTTLGMGLPSKKNHLFLKTLHCVIDFSCKLCISVYDYVRI